MLALEPSVKCLSKLSIWPMLVKNLKYASQDHRWWPGKDGVDRIKGQVVQILRIEAELSRLLSEI